MSWFGSFVAGPSKKQRAKEPKSKNQTPTALSSSSLSLLQRDISLMRGKDYIYLWDYSCEPPSQQLESLS